jgi:predicted phage tail protein
MSDELIRGAGGGGGGGKGGSGGGSGPSVQKDNLESEQTARIIDVLSEGEIEGFPSARAYARGSTEYNRALLKDIYFNNTPLVRADADATAPLTKEDYNFKSFIIEPRYGTQNQSYVPISDSIQQEEEVNVKVTKNQPATRTITDPNVNGVRVTISVPQLQVYQEDGDIRGRSVSFRILVSYNGGPYINPFGQLLKIEGRTVDLYQERYRVDLTQPPPVSIRVERITDDAPQAGKETIVDEIYWASYTELIYAKLAYPNTAHVGIQIDAKQFSSIPQRSYRVRGIKVRIPSNATVNSADGSITYSGVWNGNFKAAEWCSDPAWILWDLLTSTRYGFGDHILTSQERQSFSGDASRLDKWTFYSASQYCNARVDSGLRDTSGNPILEPRFSCNVNIQTQEEAYKLINDMCSVFRAMPFWSSGALTIAQDRPADPSYIFNQSNVTEEGFTYSGSSIKTRHTVAVVSYLDLELRDIAYEVVEDATGITKFGVVKTEVSAFACTSRGQARRIGEWLLYSEQNETEVVSFTADLPSGQVVRPGQIIRVADPVRAGRYRAGRVVNATNTTVELDRTVGELFYDGLPATFDFNVILPDGTSQSISGINGTSLNNATVTLPTPLRLTPAPNSVWAIGTTGLRPSLWRVLTVQEQDGDTYGITGISYNPSKYDYIERDQPLQIRDVSQLDVPPPTPQNLVATEALYEANGSVLSKVIVSWRAVPSATRYQLRYRLSPNNWTTIQTTAPDYEILNSQVGTYDFELEALSAGLLRSATATASFNAVGKTAPPVTIPDLFIAPIDDRNAELYWPQSTDLDVRIGGEVQIRHSPLLVNADWSRSTQIVPAVAGSSTRKIVPLLEGTYLIRAKDSLGNESSGTASVIVDLPAPQNALLVQTYREDNTTPPFQGVATDMFYDTTEVGLALAGATLVDDLATNDDWDGLALIDYAGGSKSSGSYEYTNTLDLGARFDLNLRRILKTRAFQPGDLIDYRSGNVDDWQDIDAANIGNVNAETYVRATDNNPSASPTWSAWQPFVNGITRGRGFQFKVLASTADPSQNIVLEELGVETELQRRTETQRNLTTSTAAYAVTFPNAFYATPSIGITAQDMNQGDYFTIGNATRTGFEVTFRNSAGSIVSRTFDYQAVGHGREI